MAARRASDWQQPERAANEAATAPVRRKAAVEPLGVGADLLRLQNTVGNATVVRMLASDTDVVRRGGARARAKKRAAKAAAASASTGTTTTETESAETETESGETETAETETAETESAQAPTTATAPTTPPVPVRDPKATALESVIGKAPMERMTTQFGTEAAVVTFADEVGSQKLKDLIYVRKMTAAQLQTVGAAKLKTFVGVGDAAWTHLTTAHFNSAGAISGAHDLDVFYDFLEENDYVITNRRNLGGGIVKVSYASGDDRVRGSKTLINGLAGAKSTWMATFNQAIWNALKAGTLTAGSMSYAQDDAGWDYGYFYRSGATQVDTVFPA
jgi:hypothetical protein